MTKEIKKKQVMLACQGAGTITTVAHRLGCSIYLAKRHIYKWEETRAIFTESEEIMLDLAETGLMKALKKEEEWAIKLVLKMKGKSRGYDENGDINITNNVIGGNSMTVVNSINDMSDIQLVQEYIDMQKAQGLPYDMESVQSGLKELGVNLK